MTAPSAAGAGWIETALKFAGVGVVNTLLCIGVIFGLKSLAGFGDVPANMSGYAVGLCCSFLLNRNWTFAHREGLWPALLRFLLVFGLSYLFNLAVVLGLIHAGCNAYLAHLAGMPLYSVVFYLGCRYYVFPRSPAAG
jgi:putative flippase GtrA